MQDCIDYFKTRFKPEVIDYKYQTVEQYLLSREPGKRAIYAAGIEKFLDCKPLGKSYELM